MSDSDSKSDSDHGVTLEHDPVFEARLRAALELPAPPVKLPELPAIETNIETNSETDHIAPFEHDPDFEVMLHRALALPTPPVKLPELPTIEADSVTPFEHDPDFEATLRKALELPAPPVKLPALPRIETDNVVTLPVWRQPRNATWLSLAASVVLVAFLGLRLLTPDTGSSLADEIVAHLDHEPYALRVTDQPVSDGRLAYVVPANVAAMNHDAGLITYAQSCTINGNVVPHLVIQGKNGPVTVILLPDEEIQRPEKLSGDNINGVLLPVGDGSIAIIGESGEDLEPIQQNVVNSVLWST